ncbi:acyl transferase/acyl hydrolase/lysophospholipase [Scheffersomyces amazonensis]|uniref:acyl transferase/acyl hydrolase/lysophospholipase n=1 Tax=Scheffersomyces amazonensis TaxID=1078765 RepID=UPI00315D8041
MKLYQSIFACIALMTILVLGGKVRHNQSNIPYIISDNLVNFNGNSIGTKSNRIWNLSTRITEDSIQQLLFKHKIPGFDYEKFLYNKVKHTRIALAFSGGGFRSMLLGAGVLQAYDIRSPNSSNNLGGLLQATSYIGGISGGSWLVMSNFIGDFQPIFQVKDDSKSWGMNKQLLEGIPSFNPSTFQENIVLEEENIDSPETIQLNDKKVVEEEGKGSVINGILGLFGIKPDMTSNQATKPNNLNLNKKAGNSTNVETFFISLVKSFFSKSNQTVEKSKEEKGTSLKEMFSYYKELQIEVRDKRKAGFHISLTDYWGRALARRIFPQSARTPGATITAGTLLRSFRNWEQPFPVICSIERSPLGTESSKDSHLFEFTPFEFGSWDSYLNAFIPIKYLGSSLLNGVSTHKTENENISICISGFDSVSFVTGTSSSLFNHVFVYLYKLLVDVKSDATIALESILKAFGLSSEYRRLKNPRVHPDYALYSPNPFYGLTDVPFNGARITESPDIYLVDGGDDGQNIPFQPFLQKSREIDLLLTYDMTADLNNYPNGTTIQATVDRYHNNKSSILLPYFTLPPTLFSFPSNTTTFKDKNYNSTQNKKSVLPYFPTPQEIVEDNLNQRPIFLGCDLQTDYPTLQLNQNLSLNSPGIEKNYYEHFLPPLIIHFSNADYSYKSNTSTFQLSYTNEEMHNMIENGSNIATNMNSSYFTTCMNCAILKREFDRIQLNINPNYIDSNFAIPSFCLTCFREFCWHR